MSEYEELIRKCQKKSSKAFDELYKKYSPLVYGICLRYTKNRNDAQDLLQECFIKIMDRIVDFRFEGSFEGWLRRLTVNEALNFIRLNSKSFEEYCDDSDISMASYDPDSLSSLSAQELLKYINALPDGYRTIFNLYVIEGYPHTEIAKMLNIAEATSRSQLKKAREFLIELINKKDFGNE